MKKILSYFTAFFNAPRKPVFIGLFGLLVAFFLWLTYALKVDWRFTGQSLEVVLLGRWSLYVMPCIATACLYAVLHGQTAGLRKPMFWVLLVLIPTVIAVNQTFSWFGAVHDFFPRPFFKFGYLLVYHLQSSVMYLVLPLVFRFIIDRQPIRESNGHTHFYGLTATGFEWRPYVVLLLAMLPLLIWASFQPEFLKHYPRHIAGDAERDLGVSPLLTVGTMELGYIMQFITLELFFRGFIVMRLEPYVERGGVWVMTMLYVILHFGKPFPETLGSCFGGLILGVIAYYSRSIFGGVLIHLGVAMLMEILAWLQVMTR
jgi:hypothetical protein